MKQAMIKNKISNIQNELELLKRFLVEKPDFSIDEKNWRKVKPTIKEVRKKVYQKTYGKK